MFFNPLTTGKISDNICAVKVGIVNFFIYWKGNDMICIDSGFRKHMIIKELKRLDIDPENITHLFLTHSDFDHVGGLDLFPGAKICLGVDEEQMITGKKARQLGFIFNPTIKRTYTLIEDNETLQVGSICVRAIATPGHTPGSMSYLLDQTILFTGDTLIVKDDEIHPFKCYFNMNTALQKESIRKLARLENVRMVCTAHSGYTREFEKAITRWK